MTQAATYKQQLPNGQNVNGLWGEKLHGMQSSVEWGLQNNLADIACMGRQFLK